ncbi:MAG TPA: hypothetical protein VFA45_03365 [Actinomycetes bacterium]|nr:hypothetical protein [Actinomycetes bacterium]
MSERAAGGNRQDQAVGAEEPPPFRVPLFDPSVGPPLDGDNLDAFIDWAAAVPVAATDAIRERVAAAREDSAVLEGLLKRLWDLPAIDVSRHMVLLSIIGELRNPSVVSPLNRFVWFEDQMTLSRPPGEHRWCTFEENGTAILKARATEMIAWHATDEADEAVLGIMVEHPDRAVRAAAVDAYMFNHDDSEEAMERLHQVLAPNDRLLVGLPRLTRDIDPEEFEQRVLGFYDRHYEHQPPRLGIPVPPGPTPRFVNEGTSSPTYRGREA